MAKYIVRVREEVRSAAEVEPITVEADSPLEAAQQATGVEVCQITSDDDVHDAIAVVTEEATAEQEKPKYFGPAEP